MHFLLMDICVACVVFHIVCLCDSVYVCALFDKRGSVAMLPSSYVRGELIAILTLVTAEVALEGVSEAVAAHVNGIHDVIQEEHTAVFTPVCPHLIPIGRHHLEALRSHLHVGWNGVILPLLLLLHQRQHAVPHP